MQYLIYGSKDFALILRDFLASHQLPFAGYIDDYDSGWEIVGTFPEVVARYSPDACQIVLGIGYTNLKARQAVAEKIKDAGFTIATLIHDAAYVRDRQNIGEGAIIMAHACVDCNAVIEEYAVLWPGVVVNHDSRIGANSFLSPNATVCGFVTMGPNCFVGAGAVVVDHRDVPADSFIKAGALFK